MDKEKPDKIKSSSQRFQRQFISPFPIETCVSRLEQRTEKPTLWAWKGATRVKVDVWKIDSDSAGFLIYKAPKSSLQFQIGSSLTRVEGVLFRQADGTTTVLAKARTTTFGYIAYIALVFLLWLMMALWFGAMLIKIPLVLAVAVSAGLLFGSIALLLFYLDMQHAQLLRIVQNSLGDDIVWR